MARADNNPITFVVRGGSGPVGPTGRRGAMSVAGLPGTVKASVQVATRRDGGAPIAMQAVPGEDIVALHIDGGPVLLLHPATARDLLIGPAGQSVSPRSGALTADDVLVQPQMYWPGAGVAEVSRGLAESGSVVLSGFQVLSSFLKDKAVDFATSKVVQHVDDQVDAGVYALRPDRLEKLKGSAAKLVRIPVSAQPVLVLIHGTFVETSSTFEKLWLQHPDVVRELFGAYKGAVYALDHPTLGASPIENARMLVDALPDGARLHLLTHSRGGLVAEVIARLAGQQGANEDDLAFFDEAVYAEQRRQLRELGEMIKAKSVKVERLVRVACPARGTLLASKRLDVYLSVLQWLLESAGLKILPAFVDFLGEVARRRADPAAIPGLAAMIPDTPLVSWLNAAQQEIPGDLRVIAGDLQRGSTIGSWVKALLADAYYWTDNDIVVHTASMYGGAWRRDGAQFLLDQSPSATHFTYFANDQTARAVARALLDTYPQGFRPIGPLSWAGDDASGLRGARRSKPDPAKPIVFVLPGILGSNLKQGPTGGQARIWLSPRLLGNFNRLAYRPAGRDGVLEDGPVAIVYDRLVDFLEATHEVVPFGYDWRLPLQEEAKRLAGELRSALETRKTTGQPVRLLAHSMGGLLARTVEIVAPDVWKDVMSHANARLLLLGTPNGGTWSPMQVLSGDDTFGNALSSIGSPFAGRKARDLMARMPGFIQLQAGLLDPGLGLDQESTWQQLADDDYKHSLEKNWWQRYAGDIGTAAYAWGVPPQEVLVEAKTLRLQLDAQLEGVLKTTATKLCLVVGQGGFTAGGFEVGEDGFEYLDAPDGGDGRVPLQSALLPGVATWVVDSEHGSLPSKESAFEGYLELLTTGATAKLAPLPRETFRRSGERAGDVTVATPPPGRRRRFRQAPSALPAGGLDEVLGATPLQETTDADGKAGLPVLQVSVLNGNVTFLHQPVFLGHYASLQLTGTEATVDRHVRGAMSTALRSGLYPEAPGTHRVFFNSPSDEDNPWQLPRPRAAIVVGLGDEGALSAAQLEFTICQGVKAWAQRAAEEDPRRTVTSIEIAATLIGSGGIGVSAGDSARGIARGVLLANRRLLGSQWPLVSRLVLVEQYLDRAGEAWRGVRVLADSDRRHFKLETVIASGTGPKRRQPESGYRGANYDLISVSTTADAIISFALDTRRARTEVRAQRTQSKLVTKLVQRAATASRSDPTLGNSLFKLLVPLELKPFLSGRDRMVLQLDRGTAPIPWELLDAPPEEQTAIGAPGSTEPWAIRTKLLRKLACENYRVSPSDARADDAVLIIGEPLVDDPNYPELPGARSEAEAIEGAFGATQLAQTGRLVVLNDRPTFDQVIGALMSRPWRIVHVAGHGEAVTADEQGRVRSGGVVLSEGTFLGPAEIDALEVVPELVFVNCCHLGGHDTTQTLRVANPVAFAAGVADALIAIGVRCVVAAGWAVDDRPADIFARTFYRGLLDGLPFVEAVAGARTAARDAAPDSKTWAAYQCYGDPEWRFRIATGDEQAATSQPDEFQVIASAAGLALALENLAVDMRYYSDRDPERIERKRTQTRNELRDLDNVYSCHWGTMGAVAEAFAVAWDAVGDRNQAIQWYERALQANDGSASLKAPQELFNLTVRRAFEEAQQANPGSQEIAAARNRIRRSIDNLEALTRIQPTIERLSLCGSAFKRLAQLERRDGKMARFRDTLGRALAAYSEAEEKAVETGDPQLFYPGINRMALELVLNRHSSTWAGFDQVASRRLRQSLEDRLKTEPDFWSNAGLIEFDLHIALGRGSLANALPTIAAAYGELYERVQSPGWWSSVLDQANFVGQPYRQRAPLTERSAVDELIQQLARYSKK